MSDFDNWKEEQERIHNDYDAENAWYAGQQSQQAKDIKACESVGARWQYSSLTKQVNCVPNRQKWGNQE